MKVILFFLAGLLMTGWLFGCFYLKAGTIIHVLIIMAVLFCLQGIIITSRRHN